MATGSTCKYFSSSNNSNNSRGSCYSTNTLKYHPRFLFLFAVLISWISLGFGPGGVEGKLTITKECEDLICKAHQYCSGVDHSCRPCQEACDPALGNYDKALCEKDCQDYLHDLWYMRKSDNETGPSFKEEVFLALYYKMEEDLRLLKILVGVVIILSTCVMLALFAVMIYFKRIKNQLGCYHTDGSDPCENNYNNKKQKIMDLPVIYSNNKALTLPHFQNEEEHNNKDGRRSVSSMNNMNKSRGGGGSTPDLVSRSRTSLNSSTSLPRQNSKKNSSTSAEMSQSERQQRFQREPSESTLPEYHAYENPGLIPSPTHM